MEPECSSPFSQQPAICLYSKQVQSSPSLPNFLKIHFNIINFPLLKSSHRIYLGPRLSACWHVSNWNSSLYCQICKSPACPQFPVQEDGLQTRRVPGSILHRQFRTTDKGRLNRSVARPAARNSSRQESELSTQHTSFCCSNRPDPPPGPPAPLRVLHSGGRSTNLVSSLRISGTWLHFPTHLRYFF
jgi:hypothetical protein